MEQRLIKRRDRYIWTLHNPALLEGPLDLHWNSFLVAGKGTKHQRNQIISSAKEFMLALISAREERGSCISATATRAHYYRLRLLARWMVDSEIWSFAHLTPATMLEFAKTRRNRGRGSRGGASCNWTIGAYLALFKDLWNLREFYSRPMSFDPKATTEMKTILAFGRATKRWLPLPDELAIPLLRDAIFWLKTAQPLLQPMADRLTHAGMSSRGLTRSQRGERVKKLYAELSETSEYSKICTLMGQRYPHVSETLRIAVDLTLGACLIVILFLTGMRIGEVLALQYGCLVWRTHADGTEFQYVRGVAEKRKGTVHEWIVPEPVAIAIHVAEQIFGPTGNSVKLQRVFISYPSGRGPVPTWYSRVCAIGHQRAHKLIRAFAEAGFRDVPFPGLTLHAHRARKTFARFVALRDKRSLEALAQHYGHIRRGVTDQCYVGTDIELGELLEEADYADLEATLTDLLSSSSIGGAAAKRLRSGSCGNDRGSTFRGKRGLTEIVRRLIKDGIRLAPCDWGYCLYVSDLSACRGGKAGPSSIRRSPDVCANCANFAVTEKHRSYWERRCIDDEEFLGIPGLPAQTIQFVTQRKKKTEKILADLNVKVFNLNQG